ncbi:alpha/beta hydrolase [Roseovarius rhodophyticola]|uniref:Alpha/beta hydrolase n=1 Tax=Roseovarius rhodophyticola TaxID=3080827 RepID=A0ABZ2TE47_9RHOB|nr:alpha/beta hydrolase [Roseovarius sp. W115]MDV2930392.1 alpha/beta hydrolase [Roseovarius sp. W115]
MSLARPILNAWLRWTEKSFLARAEDPLEVRRSFETKARFYFHAPFGTRYSHDKIGGRDVQWARARGVSKDGAPLLLYFHGGAYVFGSPNTHRAMLARLSADTGLPACLPTYRLAPEHPFPAALEDAVSVYRAAMERPGGVILGGDSAGGGLVLALQAEICKLGLPNPLGTFAFSPLTDMTYSGESFVSQADADVILPAERAQESADFYLNGADPKTPGASPLFAEFAGAAPVWMCVGDTEILLDDTRRMTKHLRAQRVEVTELIEHDLPHVWPLFHNLLPEARNTLRDLAQWVRSLSNR